MRCSASEDFNHLAIECRYVAGFTAGDETVVFDDLLIDPVGTCVAEIGLQRRPGRERTAFHCFCIDEQPGTVTDRGDGLAFVDEAPDEGDGLGFQAQSRLPRM